MGTRGLSGKHLGAGRQRQDLLATVLGKRPRTSTIRRRAPAPGRDTRPGSKASTGARSRGREHLDYSPLESPVSAKCLLTPSGLLFMPVATAWKQPATWPTAPVFAEYGNGPDSNTAKHCPELKRRQSYYLGCVFSLLAEWVASSKPRTKDCRHDFREWNQILDWIVRELVGCAPLMDGHQAAQERVSNPALSWLRSVALAVEGEYRLGLPLIASELVEVCELHAVAIPGDPKHRHQAKRQVGILAKQLFRDGDSLDVDGFTIKRTQKEYRKQSGDMDITNAYSFTKDSTQPPNSTQPLLTL